MDTRTFLIEMSVRLHKDYTEEQMLFMEDITKPLISFSLPGTGKTTTAVGALICAEKYHKIPGENIYAFSFTKAATLELKHRHLDSCKQIGIQQKVNFHTFSSMCSSILKKNSHLLDMPDLQVTESLTVERLSSFLSETAEAEGIVLHPNKVRSVVFAIRNLNSSLVFDRTHIESKLAFKKTGLSYDDFTTLRREVYLLNKGIEKVQLADIFLYTLELLLKYPEVSEQLKSQMKIILVDEIQDMSLLQLRLLYMMTDNLVAIGDIRQQIYAFNGACQEIVNKYKEYYPTHREINLTKSFRCADTIANYATSLILPNRQGGEDFKGNGKEGLVKFIEDPNLDLIIEDIKNSYRNNRNVFEKSIKFLYRNNYSLIPLAERLYKYRIPFRSDKFRKAHTIPVVEDFCALIELVRNPHMADKVEILNKIVPEFKHYATVEKNPIYKVMKQHNKGFFEINYGYKNGNIGEYVMSMLCTLKKAYEDKESVDSLFRIIWPVYNNLYLKEKEYYLEQPAEEYIKLIKPIMYKNYDQFVKDEFDKDEFIQKNNKEREGLECFTFHGAKGTEADIIYILDANEGIIPNESKLDETIEANCIIDAAREIRNERSLVYVACTRAKEELYITYSNILSPLFTKVNKYEKLDNIYRDFNPDYFDVEMFGRFVEL